MFAQKSFRFLGFITLVCFMMVSGCSSPPKKLDSSISGPQAIVNPETIRLGVVKMRDTNIVFEGSGFQTKPGDSVLITLTGPNETKVIAAEAPIQRMELSRQPCHP